MPEGETPDKPASPLEKIAKPIQAVTSIVGFVTLIGGGLLWTINHFQTSMNVLVDARLPSTPPDVVEAITKANGVISYPLRNDRTPSNKRTIDQALADLKKLNEAQADGGDTVDTSRVGRVRLVFRNASGSELKDYRFKLSAARSYYRAIVSADGMSSAEVKGADQLSQENSDKGNRLIVLPTMPSGASMTYDVYCDPTSVKLTLVSPETARVSITKIVSFPETPSLSFYETLADGSSIPAILSVLLAFIAIPITLKNLISDIVRDRRLSGEKKPK